MLLSVTTAYSGELVWSLQKNKELREQLKSNPLYLKGPLGLRKIKIEKVGKATSHFYKRKNAIFRNYQSDNKCFELNLKVTKTIASKTKCSDLEYVIEHKNKQFKATQSIDSLKGLEFETFWNHASKNFEAFHHQAYTVLSDLENIREFSYSEINIEVDLYRELKFESNAIVINSELRTIRSPYAFLSEKKVITSQSLKFEPAKGDLVFSNGKTLLLYKRYQPKPFNFRLLTFNQDYTDYLDQFEHQLFTHGSIQRCFRDNLIQSHPNDCDRLIFKKTMAHSWSNFELIEIDLEWASIVLLK